MLVVLGLPDSCLDSEGEGPMEEGQGSEEDEESKVGLAAGRSQRRPNRQGPHNYDPHL